MLNLASFIVPGIIVPRLMGVFGQSEKQVTELSLLTLLK